MKWLLALLLLATAAQADVIRKHESTTQMMGTSKVTSNEYTAVDRSANESVTQWTEGFMKTMMGGKPHASITITRVDKEVIWTLDPKEKTYTEMTFAELREMIQKGMQELREAQGEADSADVSEELYTWTVETKSDPNPKTIRGYQCRNVNVIAAGVHKENPDDKVWITIDVWNSPDVPGAAEIQAYQERYVKAFGLDQTALTPGLTSAVAAYQKQMEKLIKEMQKAPGEAVVSKIEIKRRQLVGPSVGEVAKEAAKEELMGKLPFGMGKKKKQAEEPRYEERIKFSITTELTEASVSEVTEAKYEIPTGFKKIEKKS